MKSFSSIFIATVFFLASMFATFKANAQCPMCKASIESSMREGNNRARGLNNGILYLLAAPYLVVGGVGWVWYKNYRRKNIPIDIRNEPINLN